MTGADRGLMLRVDLPRTHQAYSRQGEAPDTPTSDHLRALYRDKLDAGLAPRTVKYIT